jgi:hypothetical protein
LLRRQRQHGPWVGANHLGVCHPAAGVAQVLRVRDKADFVDLTGTDPKVYSATLHLCVVWLKDVSGRKTAALCHVPRYQSSRDRD